MQLIQQALTQLKLSGIRQALEQQATTPNLYQELSFHERLLMLLEHEINGRKERRVQRLIQQAKFRLRADIDNIDYQGGRNLDKKFIRTLLDGQWFTEHQNLIVTGATGCGKTYLTCALGHHFCRQSQSVYYYRLKGLLEDMYLAQAQGTHRKLLHKLTTCQLLILDDWGLEPLMDNQRSDLLEIIDKRYSEKSTVIASQIPIDKWYQMIGESNHADAILDRIIHSSIKLNLKGESMRKRQIKLTDADQLS